MEEYEFVYFFTSSQLTCHDGGVSVSAFTCVLTVLPQVSTPPFANQVTSTTLLVRWIASMWIKSPRSGSKCGMLLQTKASSSVPHTYTHCHSLCLAYTSTGSLKLPSIWRNDVACYIDTAWCHFPFVFQGKVRSKTVAPHWGKCQFLLLVTAVKQCDQVQWCMVKVTLCEANWLDKNCAIGDQIKS